MPNKSAQTLRRSKLFIYLFMLKSAPTFRRSELFMDLFLLKGAPTFQMIQLCLGTIRCSDATNIVSHVLPWCEPKLHALSPSLNGGAKTYPSCPAPIPKVQTFSRMSCPGANLNFMPCCQVSWTVPGPIPHAPSPSLNFKPLLAQHATPFYSIQHIYSATLRRSDASISLCIYLIYTATLRRSDAPTFQLIYVFIQYTQRRSDVPTLQFYEIHKSTFRGAPTLQIKSDARN